MFRVFIDMFFTSMRIASTVNHIRVGTDSAYRESIMADLGRSAARATRARHAMEPGSIPHAA